MITKEQALQFTEFHYGDCKKIVGKRGGVDIRIEHWRANGRCQIWKTRPKEFRLPIKFGMYGFSAITNFNAEEFHIPAECPIREIFQQQLP